MSDHIKQHIDGYLLKLSADAENFMRYPPPALLKNKIIIKGKGSVKKVLDSLYPNRDTHTYKKNKVFDKESFQKNKYTITNIADMDDSAIIQVTHIPSEPPLMLTKSKFEQEQLAELQDDQVSPKKGDKDEYDDEVEGIIALQWQFGLFSSRFNLKDINRSVFEISSFSESKIAKLYKKSQKAIIEWHKKYFSRIYPSGLRVDSSNYDPFLGFLCGSQFVALNVQTSDLSNLYNTGIF